ncbi:MAG: hypothetical protein JNM64_07165, partial [Chloroflexia bacterium]|nr:hypothetical protein [Chloroflexia bacterium]
MACPAPHGMLLLRPVIERTDREHPARMTPPAAENAMFPRAQPRRALHRLTATLAAVALAATLASPAPAETTHEANEAAAMMTHTPSALPADVVLAQVTAPDGTLR